MFVSVVIATRDRADVLRRCLESVWAQEHADFDVVVVDDASRKYRVEDVLEVPESVPATRVVRTERRLGVAGARNRGMEHARGRVVCVMDDDATFRGRDGLATLAAEFEADPGIGIVAVKIVDHAPGGTRLKVPFPKRVRQRRPGLLDERVKVSYYAGGCHAIRRELLNRCGAYRADAVYGEEELDLSYRAIRAGYRIVYLPMVVVDHRPEPTAIGDPTESGSGERSELYYHVRNRLYLAYRYLPVRHAVPYAMIWGARLLARALRERRPTEFLRGTADGLRRLRSVRRMPLRKRDVRYLKRNFGRLAY